MAFAMLGLIGSLAVAVPAAVEPPVAGGSYGELVTLSIGFVLGIVGSVIAGRWLEARAQPLLDLVADMSRAQNVDLEFYNIVVRNRPGRRPAWACRATIEVFREHGEPAIREEIPARWSSQPEPTVQFAVGNQVGNVFDLPRAIQGRRADVHSHLDERIPIAIKQENDPDCYIFTNESYLPAHSGKNPNWRLPQGRYRVRVTVYYESGQAQKDFELRNGGPSRDDVHLRLWPTS
ncbi:MAG TPA: hypothetical protein VKU02_03950 [Gemmataceae bacterium]|nr:hypothetical protein [Gemmataceae bacterium]